MPEFSSPRRTAQGIELPLQYARFLSGYMLGIATLMRDYGIDNERCAQLRRFAEEIREPTVIPGESTNGR